jgi:hypothetical protein
MALPCYAFAPSGGRIFSTLLDDSERSNSGPSNSGPARWAFPHNSSGEGTLFGGGRVHGERACPFSNKRCSRYDRSNPHEGTAW